jgi:hypothetical protein
MSKPSDDNVIAFLSGKAKEIADGDEVLERLMNISVTRVLARNDAIAESKYEFFGSVKADVLHIRDWLKSSLVNDMPWLHRLDDQGRPKKLMKCGTLEALVREANKEMRRQAAKAAGVKLIEGDEALEYECENGWTVVRLLTEAALDLESGRMGHCIGNGAYDGGLADPNVRFLSLRDRAGKPHATMEIVGNKLIQLQGKQNEPPLKRYLKKIIPFFNRDTILCTDSDVLLVTDVEGRSWLLDELPETIHIHSEDTVGYLTLVPEWPLPRHLRMNGHLRLVGAFQDVPEMIETSGTLSIEASGGGSMTRLPKTLVVGGNLYLQELPIEELPADLSVGCLLQIKGTKITSLPPGIRCRDFNITETAIKTFDTALFANGKGSLICRRGGLEEIVGTPKFTTLLISHCPIAALPEGLEVEGDFDLQDTQVTRLPEGLKAGEFLEIKNCRIESVPELIITENLGFVDCDLNFSATFTCTGSVKFSHSRILSAPEDFMAADIYFLHGCEIDRLPKRLRAKTVHLEEIAPTIAEITGDIVVENMVVKNGITRLGPGVTVSETLKVSTRIKDRDWLCLPGELSERNARKMIAEFGVIDLSDVPSNFLMMYGNSWAETNDDLFEVMAHFVREARAERMAA